MTIKKPPTAEAQGLPRDLDGDYYRTDDLGPWKVTPCCGAYVKGGEDCVYCRGCYENMDDFHDAPARLGQHIDGGPSMPAWLTAVKVDLLDHDPADPRREG